MIRSMTGFGKVEWELDQGTLSVEVRSVNSRYFDFSIRFPEIFEHLEEEIKRRFSQQLIRGRVKVFITLNGVDEGQQSIQLNREKAGHYRNLLKETAEFIDSSEPLTLAHILNFPDIFDIQSKDLVTEKLKNDLFGAIDAVIKKVMEMQQIEGGHLAEDILQHIAIVEDFTGKIKALSGRNKQDYFRKFREKLLLFTENLNIDESRLIQEAALIAKKIDVTEECERLSSHLKQFRSYRDSVEPVGKRMTFLLQEMNREISTIGAKSEDTVISHYVVEVKNELEKIREQAQNIL